MPRVDASNGIRPEIRALGVIKLNVPVTPSEINDFVKTGNYAAKYISFLRRMGFVFNTNKDSRSVVSYTLVKEPDNTAEIRGTQVKSPAPKAPKTKAPAPVMANAPAASDDEGVRDIEPVAPPIITAKIVTSFASVDPDFDAFEGDLKELV